MGLLKPRTRLTEIQRSKDMLVTSVPAKAALEKRRAELVAELAKIDEALLNPPDTTVETIKSGKETEYTVLDHEANLIVAKDLQPAYIKAGLLSITGYEVDGKAATIDAVLTGPNDALLDEIYERCVEASGLSADARKNSQSAGTSTEQADTPAAPTTA